MQHGQLLFKHNKVNRFFRHFVITKYENVGPQTRELLHRIETIRILMCEKQQTQFHHVRDIDPRVENYDGNKWRGNGGAEDDYS